MNTWQKSKKLRIIVILLAMTFMTSCAAIKQIALDPEVQQFAAREIGYFASYYVLFAEPTDSLLRIQAEILDLLEMTDLENLRAMILLTHDFIENHPPWQTGNSEAIMKIIGRSLSLLDNLLVMLDKPEAARTVERIFRAFLEGAKEGIGKLMILRYQNVQGERS